MNKPVTSARAPCRRARPIASALALLLASVALAGCDNNSALSQAFNASFQESYIKSCVEEIGKRPESKLVKKDWNQVCGCMADHMLGIATGPADLVAKSNDDKEIEVAVNKCVK